MLKRIISIILVMTLIMGNNVSMLASEIGDDGQTVLEERGSETEEGYELIIEDGVVTGYTGTPVDVVIPDGVTEIGDNAFSGCSSLTSIEIPEGVIEIGFYAFKNCSSLTSVIIPKGVTIIRNQTFEGCSGLTSVTIPESVEYIYAAFTGCSSLTSIEIPEGVTYITDTFKGCSSLTSGKRSIARTFS